MRLETAAGYLKGVEKVTWAKRAGRHDEMKVDVHVDRIGTTGGVTMINGTVVKHWSRTQATRALSTAEAEYYEVVTGAAEAIRNAVDDDGLGTESTGSCLDGLQSS